VIRVDALVLGGGPAGAAAAMALQRSGGRALVVERSSYAEDRAADTLAAPAKLLLQRLGLAESEFEAARIEANGIRSAWDRCESDEQNFLFSPHGAAWHVDRRRFDAALAEAAAAAGAQVWSAARLVGAERDRGRWRARIEQQGRTRGVEARIVIDAGGRAARFARAQGSRRLSYDRLVGLSAALVPRARRSGDGSMLLLEAAPSGWWYSIPVADERLLACYVTDSDLLLRGTPLVRTWTAALDGAPYTRARVRQYRRAATGDVRLRAAGVGCLSEAAGSGWLAIGDAAASLDPLSGMGLFKALESGMTAAHAIGAGAAALADHARLSAEGFRKHLAERARLYGRVERFAGSAFWRRRRPIDPWSAPITLDPRSRLSLVQPAPSSDLGARLEGLLPKQDLARLRSLCAAPIEAHRVVAALREVNRSGADDRAAIVALQMLIEDRMIEIV
jgi:flavin-dependent dehydrogenase